MGKFNIIEPAPLPLTNAPFSSSVYFGTRRRTEGYGSNKMPGSWDADIPNKFFNFLEPRFGDALKVAEYFMGGGTTSDLCHVRNIPFTGVDLRPAPRKTRTGEHWETNCLDWTPDFDPNCILSHDPYGSMIKYSENVWNNGQGHPQDLSLSTRSYNEFLDLINQAHAKAWTHLVPGGYMLVMTGVQRKNGVVRVIADDMYKFGTQIARIIKVQQNANSNFKKAAGGYGNSQFISTDHEEILIWKKEDRFIVMVSMTQFKVVDMRKGTRIPWQRVAIEALRENGKEYCSWDEIYETAQKLFPNQCSEKHLTTWKNSLRRAVYENKNRFNNAGNEWGLVA